MKKLLLSLILLVPVLSFAQSKQNQEYIDSMVSELPKFTGNKTGTALMYGNIGSAYCDLKDYTKALENYNKSLKLYDQLNNKIGLARVEGNIGSAYLSLAEDTINSNSEKISLSERKANLAKAIDLLTRSVSLSKENGYLDVLEKFSKDLCEAQSLMNYNVALGNESHYTIKGLAIDPKTLMNLSNQESRREQELKDKQTQLNHVEATQKFWGLIIFIVAIIIMLVVSIVMYTVYRKQKASSKLISAEKQKSEDLLLNILPAQIADELKEKGMTHAQQYDDVTVIITDFVGFTTVAERFSPKQLVGELHACFKAFDGMLENYKIEKIKTVGDAYLAVAGLPSSNPNHAADALSCAIQMRDFMLYRKTQLGEATFEMRIGVHSGSVVAGIVGVKKFAYDIWGDTVNLAARMEQNSEPGKINISQSTYDLVSDKFDCEYRGEIMAKKKGKLKMYFVNRKL